MASERIMLISTVLILGHWSFCISCGIVFVTTTYRKKKIIRKTLTPLHFPPPILELRKGMSTHQTLADENKIFHYYQGQNLRKSHALLQDCMYPWILKGLSFLPFILPCRSKVRYENIPRTEGKSLLILPVHHLTTSLVPHCYSLRRLRC